MKIFFVKPILLFLTFLLLCSMCACEPQQLAVSSQPFSDDEFSDSLTDESQEYSSDIVDEACELISYEGFRENYSWLARKWEIEHCLSSSVYDEHFCTEQPKLQIGKLVETLSTGFFIAGDWYWASRSSQGNAYSLTAEQVSAFTGIGDIPVSTPSKKYYDFFVGDFQSSDEEQIYQISFCVLDSQTLLLGFCGNYYIAINAENTLLQKFSYKDWLTDYSYFIGHYSLSDVVTSTVLGNADQNKWVETLAMGEVSVSAHGILLSEQQYIPKAEENVRLNRYVKHELSYCVGYLTNYELPFLKDDCLLSCFELEMAEESGNDFQTVYIFPIDKTSFMIGVGGVFCVATKIEM